MLQLLIVDDEPLAIRSVLNAIDWEKAGVSKVYTANNAKQAKTVFAEQPIDIMLCDIEMPQESGLELLAWVRERSPGTQSIFLTCHADFGYAKKAIQLGSLDYLLKPIPPDELEAVIRKAVEQAAAEGELKQHSESWVKHHPLFIERFWSDILSRTIPSTPAAIRAAAQERNIRLPEDMAVLPVLIQVRRWHKTLSQRDEKIMEYALINAFQEAVQEEGNYIGMVPVGSGQLLAVLSGMKVEPKRLKERTSAYIASCQRFFYCDLVCYIGVLSPIHELPEVRSRLERMMKENATADNQALLLSACHTAAEHVPLPDMKVWQVMLQEGNKQGVLQEVRRYLERLKTTPGVKTSTLHQFVQDLLQIVYSILQEQGIQAHKLFQDAVSIELSERATFSINDLMQWTDHLIGKALGYAAEVGESESLVGKVKAYITQHLDQDLNRESIAGPFFLHPDYINRMFKKETGLSMTEYLLQERMRVAAEHLRKTEQPVTTIAANIGYSNLSHFAKVFRKHTGLNPNEYRQQGGKGTDT